MQKIKARKELHNSFITEIILAINKYGEKHIDIIIDTDDNKMYLSYHSENNSFNVSKDYPLTVADAVETANTFNIGWSEI